MLECPGSLCLNTWPKTDTCRHASSELAKRLVQAPGRSRLAEVVRDRECPDNLLRPRKGKSRHLRNRARTDSDLRDSRYRDRKSTRLNSSHQIISYAVFC